MMFVFSQLGSEGLTLITLFGICFVELLIMCSVILLVYLLMSASLRLSQLVFLSSFESAGNPLDQTTKCAF